MIFSHQLRFPRYQRIVFFIPSANIVSGFQPSSALIFVGSMAYRRSWPFRSATKVISPCPRQTNLLRPTRLSFKTSQRELYQVQTICHRTRSPLSCIQGKDMPCRSAQCCCAVSARHRSLWQRRKACGAFL